MNKVLTLGVAVLSALAAATTANAAAGEKHFGAGRANHAARPHVSGHGNGFHRPVYVAPAPFRSHYGPARPHYAPTRGYWHGGRWIAPVVVGGLVAAAIGSSYYAAPVYGYSGYAAPSYYAPAAVSYAAPVSTGFEYADANRDGYVSFDEAAVYPHWQRNFGLMDRNRDGYLSHEEVHGWRFN
jgi:hypothetical protein